MVTKAHMLKPLDPADFRELTEVFVAAFFDDPAFIHLVPSDARRWRGLRWLFGQDVQRALKYRAEIMVVNELEGGCIFWEPGTYPPVKRHVALDLLANSSGLLSLPPRSVLRGIGMWSLVDARHPAQAELPHYYVGVLGIHPEHQGGGRGGVLLDVVCGKADEEGVAVYLETTKEKNVSYYGRFGFEVAGEERFKGGPPVWFMLRPARP